MARLNFIVMSRGLIEISGHIIDSLLLAKILDLILGFGAVFEIIDLDVGQRRDDRSYARIQIDAPNPEILDRVLAKLKEHGAVPVPVENSVQAENRAVRKIGTRRRYSA